MNYFYYEPSGVHWILNSVSQYLTSTELGNHELNGGVLKGKKRKKCSLDGFEKPHQSRALDGVIVVIITFSYSTRNQGG